MFSLREKKQFLKVAVELLKKNCVAASERGSYFSCPKKEIDFELRGTAKQDKLFKILQGSRVTPAGLLYVSYLLSRKDLRWHRMLWCPRLNKTGSGAVYLSAPYYEVERIADLIISRRVMCELETAYRGEVFLGQGACTLKIAVCKAIRRSQWSSVFPEDVKPLDRLKVLTSELVRSRLRPQVRAAKSKAQELVDAV